MFKPYFTSHDLIESIKRRSSVPIDQIVYKDEDLLAFVNEEMFISQVPSILQYHEEYFVEGTLIELEPNKNEYDIPTRAIGMRLRDIYYSDGNITPENPYGSLRELTRIGIEDISFYNTTTNQINNFYLKGNKICLIPPVGPNPTGFLYILYFMRPNQLVLNERAGFIQSFKKLVTINNSLLNPGDKLIINNIIFEAVLGLPSGNQFQIGTSSIITAFNLSQAINNSGIAQATNGSPSTNICTITFDSINYSFLSTNNNGISISNLIGLELDNIPNHFNIGTEIDFLQTLPGHRTKGIDKKIKEISSNIVFFEKKDIPLDLVIGDYICSANECIIPQIPPDLHANLAERAAARMFSALGDIEALSVSNQKIQEMEKNQGTLIDSRVDGAPIKINKQGVLKFIKKRRF